jgi:serine/threonine-protein kinase RsbW
VTKSRRKPATGSRRKTSRRAELVLTIPSGTEFLSLVRDVTRRLGELSGFPAPTAERLALAVDECTTNVIRHAYRGQSGQPIEIRFEPDGRDFQVEVIDEGETVDPRAVPRVDLQRYAAERKKGGLGVHLMGKIMDSVTYCRSAQRNVCRMVKQKPVPARGRA